MTAPESCQRHRLRCRSDAGASPSFPPAPIRFAPRVFDLAGYDPKQASGFYLTLLELIPPDAEGSTSLFASHPETRERVDKLNELAAGLPSPPFKAASRGYADLRRGFPTRKYFRRDPEYSRS